MCISFITYPLSVFDKFLSKITVLLARYKKSREIKYFIRTVTLVNDMFLLYPNKVMPIIGPICVY